MYTEEVKSKKNRKAVKQAKDANVYIVKEEFLEASKKGGAALFIKNHSLCDWGSDVSISYEENMLLSNIITLPI